MRNKRAKRNLIKALHISLITGLSFGTIAMAIAVPISLNTVGIKEFQHFNLNKEFPKLKNFFAMSDQIANEELSDVILIDKIQGFENFRRKKRSAQIQIPSLMQPEHETIQSELARRTTIYIFQRPHMDNRVFYVETTKNRENIETVDLAFEFSGVEVVDLVETLKLGNEVLGNGELGENIKGPFRELLNNMREISIRSMRFIANQLNMIHDNNGDPYPEDFSNGVFEKQLALKIKKEQDIMDQEFEDLAPSRATRSASHVISNRYQGQDGRRFMVTKEDIFEHILFHNMEMQKEFSGNLINVIQEIKDHAFKNIILSNDSKKMKSAFSNPIFWMEGISQIIVNESNEFNTMQNLKILFDFSKKYIPADSIKSMDDAFYHAIDITIDGLLERYEEYENTHPNNLISRDINFSIPIANGKNTMERLTKTIAAVRRGKQSTKPEIAEIFNGWKSIDFEVLMDKSDSYARTVIFRTVNLKRPKTIFAHEALNIFTGVKGFISYKEYKLVNDAFIPIFNELIEAADSDATGNSPELSYLLKMLSGHEDFNGDFIKYRNVFSWLHHWFDKYHVNLNAQREETMLSDLDENLDDGLSSHHNIFDASKRDNWIYDDMMLLISQIILHEIVRGHDFIEEWDDETGKHHTAVGELERHFEAERMIPGTPEYKEWVDPYEMIEEVALSMNEIGIKVDKNMINKYIMRKRRRRRR